MLSSCGPKTVLSTHSGTPMSITVSWQFQKIFQIRSYRRAPRFWLVKVMAAWKTAFIAV